MFNIGIIILCIQILWILEEIAALIARKKSSTHQNSYEKMSEWALSLYYFGNPDPYLCILPWSIGRLIDYYLIKLLLSLLAFLATRNNEAFFLISSVSRKRK